MLKIKRAVKDTYFIKNGTDGLIDSVRGIIMILLVILGPYFKHAFKIFLN